MSISESDLSRPGLGWPGHTTQGSSVQKNYRDRASLCRIKLQTISKHQELWLASVWLTWTFWSWKTNWTTCRFPISKKLIPSQLLIVSRAEGKCSGRESHDIKDRGPSQTHDCLKDCFLKLTIKQILKDPATNYKTYFRQDFNNCVQNKLKIHQFKISANSGCQNLNLICHLQTAQQTMDWERIIIHCRKIFKWWSNL